MAPILELKKMIQAYHEAGIGVIMDVVYNHTYSLTALLSNYQCRLITTVCMTMGLSKMDQAVEMRQPVKRNVP